MDEASAPTGQLPQPNQHGRAGECGPVCIRGIRHETAQNARSLIRRTGQETGMDQKTDAIPPAGAIGYVCKRYPRFSETFIVNEILAHEAAGQPIEIFSLRPSDETHFQDILSRVRAGVTRIGDRPKPTGQFWEVMQLAFAHYPQGVARLLAE